MSDEIDTTEKAEAYLHEVASDTLTSQIYDAFNAGRHLSPSGALEGLAWGIAGIAVDSGDHNEFIDTLLAAIRVAAGIIAASSSEE